MKSIVFASNNANKLKEIQKILPEVEILSLKDINCFDELPETQDTLQGNALQKARYVKENYGYDCFADDTGLMIDALNGEPGVYSARYAGPSCSAEDNMKKVLELMEGKEDRKARFKTVIALVTENEEKCFEGAVEGKIETQRAGSDGFGYDPIFTPEGFDQTFAEISLDIKNQISHRGRATKAFADYLLR